jgi:hypothetical protein
MTPQRIRRTSEIYRDQQRKGQAWIYVTISYLNLDLIGDPIRNDPRLEKLIKVQQ